jgi:hypothetical protein
MFENMPGGGNGVAAPPVVNPGQALVAQDGPRPGPNDVAPVAGSGGAGGNALSIGGISALKGIILYGATLTFAALYAYFITRIFGAKPGHPPKLDGVMVSTAAALAGVLGSAFALEIGTSPAQGNINRALGKDLRPVDAGSSTSAQWAKARIRQVFSLEPADTSRASWPKTFGIWLYALVATGVALTYILNQNETPAAIKALAVAFAGYVIALVNSAYNLSKRSDA